MGAHARIGNETTSNQSWPSEEDDSGEGFAFKTNMHTDKQPIKQIKQKQKHQTVTEWSGVGAHAHVGNKTTNPGQDNRGECFC